MLRSGEMLRLTASFARAPIRLWHISCRKAIPVRSDVPRATFFDSLRECRSPTEVLELVNGQQVEQRCISGGLMRMWWTAKAMSDEQRRRELGLMAEHPAFERLCRRAGAEAPHMPGPDLAFTLMALVRLGVSQSSFVVQSILRVIQERLSQFEDEKELSVLAVCLAEMDDTRNAEALKEGLKLVLEDRIPTIQNVKLLHAAMRIFGSDASPVVKRKLENRALSMADDFTVPNAQHMLATLAAVHLRSRPLLDVCSKKIAENVHSVPFTGLMVVLRSCCQLRYRNLALFTSISDYMADTITVWTNKQIILLLLQFKDLRYRPLALLDAFAKRILQKPDSLTLRDLHAVLECCSTLNHLPDQDRQEFLACLTQVLDSYLPRMSGVDVLKAVGCLCVFAHFPQAALEKLFQTDVLAELLPDGPGKAWAERTLHEVDTCLRLDKPHLPAFMVPVPRLQDPQGSAPNLALTRALKVLVGDEAVTESVLVGGVYLVDYVITLPPSGEETQHSPKRIAVILAPPSSYCFGTTHPCRTLALKIRHLKLLGYEPAPVPLQELGTRTGEERIDVLRKYVLPEQRGPRAEI